MFIVSVIFLWSFSAEQYLELSTSQPRTKSLGGALLDVLDVRDIFHGIRYMYRIAICYGSRSKPISKEFGGEDSDLESEALEMRR